MRSVTKYLPFAGIVLSTCAAAILAARRDVPDGRRSRRRAGRRSAWLPGVPGR
ncbi:hypothetical protein [Plantactinospora soyae]|uniref:Uncharacterized protein n=1 Tax=Plantactinospora soyae TaxID=1544732 RepID=A0A927R657_9ACTN|nr:hypothetical protein [Plantactinospora soyae]MBE1488114.1 hypothetical protein [Plantactinospora soyae]